MAQVLHICINEKNQHVFPVLFVDELNRIYVFETHQNNGPSITNCNEAFINFFCHSIGACPSEYELFEVYGSFSYQDGRRDLDVTRVEFTIKDKLAYAPKWIPEPIENHLLLFENNYLEEVLGE